MTTSLDVLLIESHPGAGSADAYQLEIAGHRVHHCYPAAQGPGGDGRVLLRERYLCTGVTKDSCPLNHGIDVALLVRRRLATRPAASEGGVTCALRAGIPVVEDGPEILDPFEPWLAGRVTGNAAAACAAAVERVFEPARLTRGAPRPHRQVGARAESGRSRRLRRARRGPDVRPSRRQLRGEQPVTRRRVELFATAAALAMLVPLAVYLPWLLVGGALAAWAGSLLCRRLRRTGHAEGRIAGS